MNLLDDTIAAISTPLGEGGIGIGKLILLQFLMAFLGIISKS